MEYSPTLCFAGFISKKKNPARKKRKTAIAAVYVAIEFCVPRQTSKLIVKELCRDKRQCVAPKNGKNLTSQLRQRKFMLQQGFSVGCQHQEEFFTTNKLLLQQMKQS